MAHMEQVAEGVHRIPLMPLDGINAYLVGDVIVDAGVQSSAGKIIRAIGDRPVSAHALTHAHVDHQGGSHALCEHYGVPLWCGEPDRRAMETGDQTLLFPNPGSFMARMSNRMAGPAHHVARNLVEGDRVADFTVIATPGHTAGHVSFWRESDRVLILGDVLFNRHMLTMRKGLTEPMAMATADPARNRDSARKIAALEPAVVCFGHGPPVRDPVAIRSFVDGMPA